MQELYSPKRQFERQEASGDDDALRVRLTLLEYGDAGPAARQNMEQQVGSNTGEIEVSYRRSFIC